MRPPRTPPPYRRPDLPFERGATLWSKAGSASAAGLEFGLCVALLFLGGSWLDGKAGTSPWLSVAGALVGVAGGMVLLVRRFLREPPLPREGADRREPPARTGGD